MLIRYLLPIVLIVSFSNCENTSPDKNDSIRIACYDIDFFECTSDSNLTPSMYIQKQDEFLYFHVYNTEFCCSTDSISILCDHDNNEINLTLVDMGPLSYCFCPHEVEFSIGPLKNEVYGFTYIESEHSYQRDTIQFDIELMNKVDTLIYANEYPCEHTPLTHVKTVPGGCYGQRIFDSVKRAAAKPDTVIFSILNDTLEIFAGINYICCAPFTTSTRIIEDSLIFTLSDTCNITYHDCYCRCYCYYTFTFHFINYEEDIYSYRILLDDPRNDSIINFKQGIIDITSLLGQ